MLSYFPSAFSFSSRSPSSGHLLERRVWARSPIPHGAEACYNSTFAVAKHFSKNYSTATSSSSCISSHQFGTHEFRIKQLAALEPQRHRRKPKRYQSTTGGQTNLSIHTHTLSALSSRWNGPLYIHMKMEGK